LGEPVPEENFWTLLGKGRLREADTLTIQLGATPCGLTSEQQQGDFTVLIRYDTITIFTVVIRQLLGACSLPHGTKKQKE